MKKLLLGLFLSVGFMLAPLTVHAVDVTSPVCDNPNAVERPAFCDDAGNGESDAAADNPIFGPNGILTRAISILSFIAGFAAVLMIMIGGFRYVTSSGDSNTTAAAQKTIIYGVVGLVVVALSQVIVIFVLGRLR
jgi:hypothetical protein